MKSPKSSHTGDPLTAVLISYHGEATRPPKTPGNLNGIYNTPKQYSRSTNNGEVSKRPSCMVRTLVFSSRLSLLFPRSRGANLLRFRATLLVLQHVILVQLFSLSPRIVRQSMIPPCLSCHSPSSTVQHSLCFRSPTTTPCHSTRKTVVI